MKAKIINSEKEFEEFYYYSSKPREYPEEYPCACLEIDEDGGIGGSYYRYVFIYAPHDIEFKHTLIYLDGVLKGWEVFK